MTRARRARAGGLCLALVLTAACARLVTPLRTPSAADHAAVLAALTARERALADVRLSMRVRAAGTGAASLLAAPAFLAVDGGNRLRLQVLSPLGPTVFDLEIAGVRFRLRLPLRGESRRGRIDATTLTDRRAPPAERLIVALALLFRPRMRAEACAPAGVRAVRCALGDGLTTTVRVDARLRPLEEAIAGTDGVPLLIAEYAVAASAARNAAPARVTLRDAASDATLQVRIVRARAAGARPTP